MYDLLSGRKEKVANIFFFIGEKFEVTVLKY